MKMARTKNSNAIIDTRLGAISLRTNTGKFARFFCAIRLNKSRAFVRD